MVKSVNAMHRYIRDSLDVSITLSSLTISLQNYKTKLEKKVLYNLKLKNKIIPYTKMFIEICENFEWYFPQMK